MSKQKQNVLPFASVSTFMIFDFGSSCKRFATCSANEWLVTGMNDFMHLQIVLWTKLFAAHLTFKLFDARMGANVLGEILIAEKWFATFFAFERSLAIVMDFHVCGQRIFWGKIFGAMWTFIWAETESELIWKILHLEL